MSEIVAKLRYQGKQYSNGKVARGGNSEKHYLEEAADLIEKQESKIASLREKLTDLRGQARRVRNFSNPDEVFEAIPLRFLMDELEEANEF